MLRVRGGGVGLCIRPIAFGNALGNAIGGSITTQTDAEKIANSQQQNPSLGNGVSSATQARVQSGQTVLDYDPEGRSFSTGSLNSPTAANDGFGNTFQVGIPDSERSNLDQYTPEGRLKTLTGNANRTIIDIAASSGQSLAPTIGNAAGLGLYIGDGTGDKFATPAITPASIGIEADYDSKYQAGTFDRFNEIGAAFSRNGSFTDKLSGAYDAFMYTAPTAYTDFVKANQPDNIQAAIFDNMLAGPVPAIFAGVTRLFNGSDQSIYTASQIGVSVDGVLMAGGSLRQPLGFTGAVGPQEIETISPYATSGSTVTGTIGTRATYINREFDPKTVEINSFGRYLTNTSNPEIRAQFVSQAAEIRAGLPLELQERGNLGIAVLDVPGLPSNLRAFSGIQDGSYGFTPKPTGPSILDFLNVSSKGVINGSDAFARNVDTEYKILETAARTLGDNRLATGRIDLFTERKACASCSPGIQTFRKIYPGIQLNIFTGK
jgi:hypothetical protein